MSYGNLALYDYCLLSNIRDVEIVFFGNKKYRGKSFKNNIFFVPIFKYSAYTNRAIKFISYLYSLLAILIYIIVKKPRVVHIQWFKMPLIDIPFCKALKKIGVVIIYTVHNVLPHDSGKTKVKLYKKIYGYATNLIVHTHRTKEELVEEFKISPNKINVVPHGILRTEYNYKKSNTLSHLRNKDKIVFSLLGTQSKYKGYELVFELWSKEKLLRDNKNIVLLVMGKNKNLDFTLLDGIENVILIPRYISDQEFQEALKITSILLMPYQKISQSGLLMTAIGENIPFLVSSVGELEEPLNIANVGWSMGEPNYENLKKSIFKILKNKKQISMVKNNIVGWLKVEENYSWDRAGKLTSKLYRVYS